MQPEPEKRLSSILKTVEALGGCRVCCHDFYRPLLEYLPDVPVFHRNEFCAGLKKQFPQQRGHCIRFDRNAVVRHLEQLHRPFFKQCPHQVLELVVPIYRGAVPYGVIFLGPYRGAAELPPDSLCGTCRLNDKIRREAARLYEKLPVLDRTGMTHLFNLGRMLASCLAEILAELEPPPEPEGAGRRQRIEQFIARNFNRGINLDDLADALGLSASRTSRLLKEHFQAGFPELVNQRRLQAAVHFLERSELSVQEAGRRAGFAKAEHFHRVFRQAYQLTPLEYRRRFRRGGEPSSPAFPMPPVAP